MRKTRQWLATATMLLCGAASMQGQNVTVVTSSGELKVVPPPPVAISKAEVIAIEEVPLAVEENKQPSPIILSVEDGLLSTTSMNEANGMLQYEYTSSVITLDGSSNVLYFTFLETHTEPQYVTNENKRQYPFVALSEFQLYDANGKEIKLKARNISTNAQEITEGPVAHICDGNRNTYFHSTWSSQTPGYHYLRIELPDTLSAFSFKYYTRDWGRCIPKKISIKGAHSYQVRDIELTEKDGLLSTISVNDKNNIAQYEYTSPVLTLKEPSNVLYFDFLEGHSIRPQHLLDKNGFPYMALAEFQLYDANGKEIELDARNFSTNAPERFEGPIADICDGNRSTHFHTTWTAGASDYHHLRVALPDTLSAFSFKYYTRNTMQCVPKKIGIRGVFYYDGHQYVRESQNPYNQILAQGTCGENVSWKLMFGGHLIISGTGDMEIQRFESPWKELGIAKVTIEHGVTSISDRAFFFCTTLASISIPASVIKIGHNSFSNCTSLSSIEVHPGNPIFDSRENSNAIIKTGANALIVGCYATRIPESVVSIEEEAFSGCDGLTSLYIPKSVTSINKHAFSFCPLKTIIVAEDNPVYDSRGYCNAIIETRSNTLVLGCPNTIIPASVVKIGDRAFSTCRMESIAIPGNIVSIGSDAFAFSTLSSIYIPQSVRKIHTDAFSFCSQLTSIVVDENNEFYDSRNNCNAIIETATNTLIRGCSSTIIPEGITKIGKYAFNSISELTSIVIPEGVTEIGPNAFYDCDNLSSVTFPKSITKIGTNAFKFCSKLTSITLPKSVTEIGIDAFEYCRELTTVTLPKRFKGRENEIFGNCDNLEKIRYKGK